MVGFDRKQEEEEGVVYYQRMNNSKVTNMFPFDNDKFLKIRFHGQEDGEKKVNVIIYLKSGSCTIQITSSTSKETPIESLI